MATETHYWDTIPFIEPDAETARTGGADLAGTEGYAVFRMPRRSLLKTATVLGTALALTVVSAVPKRLTPKAKATVGTQHTNCSIYSYDNVICVGAPYSANYCGNDGWFLNYRSASFNSWPVTVCNGRNAWLWYHGRTYRCADGYQQVTGQSAQFRICSS